MNYFANRKSSGAYLLDQLLLHPLNNPKLEFRFKSVSNLALLPFFRVAEAICAADDRIALLTPYQTRHPAAHQAFWDELHATLAKARAAANPDGGPA